MLDLGFVRANLELVEEKLRARGADPAALLGDFRALDKSRREAITLAEQSKARRNELSQQVGALKKAGKDDEAAAVMEETRALKDKLDELDQTAAELDEQLRLSLARIPNLTRDEVPVGNIRSRQQDRQDLGREAQNSTFQPKPHWEIGETLGILDLERAAKLSGARFAVYMGAGARLERALISFMLDLHTQQARLHRSPAALHGQLQVALRHRPVAQVCRRSLPLLRCRRRSRQRAASSRTTTTGSSPPPRFPSPTSTATRSSTRRACPSRSPPTRPASAPRPAPPARTRAASSASTSSKRSSWSSSPAPRTPTREHERLTRDAEEILEALDLPYRRVLLCTGDTGFSSAKTYDLEVWLPGQNLYREISSCSNFDAFQARRANIRYRPVAGAKAKPEFVHTLNGSGLAVGRTWLAILENYQQADGSVAHPRSPAALHGRTG